MEGKIFSESSNIYQDQAKILFDYYKNAAEKIVAKEVNIETRIKQIEDEIEASTAERAKLNTHMIIWFCTIIGFIVGIMKYFKIKEVDAHIIKLGEDLVKLDGDYQNIFRDYRVEKLGVAYVPVASRVAFNDKSFLVDHTGSTKDEKFTLQILRQNQLINSSINELRKLTQEAPIVEESNNVEKIETATYSRSIQSVKFHDYFGKLDRTLRTISYCLSDKDETTVELPVIFPNTSYANFLSGHATSNSGNCPVFNVFNTKQHDAQINGFKELNETRKSMSNDSQEVDLTLRHLMVEMASSVQTTAAMKVSSVSSLVDYSNKLLFNILKAPYNFYSPTLEADEIERIKNESFNYGESGLEYKPFDLRESSRMRFDLISMCWSDDSGSKSIAPFGVNQIQSEIMAPIVTNLLKETCKDRLAVYNHIKDQKIDYLNQWHRDTEDFYGRNRAEATDLINLMRANLTDYTAAYNTLAAYKKTEENMRNSASLDAAVTEAEDNSVEVLMAYKEQSDQFKKAQDDFSSYMERLKVDIDVKAEKFGHVEHYDASLRDRKSKDLALAVDNVSNLDDRRKPLAEVNPLLAQISDLPPAPSVEEMTYEHVGLNLMTLAQEVIEDLDCVAKGEAPKGIKTTVSIPKPTIPSSEGIKSIISSLENKAETNDEDVEVVEKVETQEEKKSLGYTNIDELLNSDSDEVSKEVETTTEKISDDEPVEETEIIEEEVEENVTEEVEETEEEDVEEESNDFEVGMELYDLDDDGNKLYYEDGEYGDDENDQVIVVKDGKIVEIRDLSETAQADDTNN